MEVCGTAQGVLKEGDAQLQTLGRRGYLTDHLLPCLRALDAAAHAERRRLPALVFHLSVEGFRFLFVVDFFPFPSFFHVFGPPLCGRC
jgi:hypothetical protein